MGQDGITTKNDKSRWDKLWRNRKRLYVYRNVIETAENYLGGAAGRTILEVGCGRGATLLALAGRGANVVGLDYSEEALTICRERKSRNGIAGRADFVHGDARKLPFPSESFDFVFSVGLIEHFEDPAAILAEQYRVLRKGGFLFVQVPQKYSLYTALKKMLIRLGKWKYGGWETQFSDRQISILVADAGLETRSVYGYGSFFLAAMRHAFLPTLDFGMMWRSPDESKIIRAIRAKTALDICVVARKASEEADAETPSAVNAQEPY